MIKNKIDIEKDHLVIARRLDGEYKFFCWYQESNGTVAETETFIAKHNSEARKKNDYDHGFIFEYVTDGLIRKICADVQHSRSYELLMDTADDFGNSIESAEECIQEAESHIDDAKMILDKLKKFGR